MIVYDHRERRSGVPDRLRRLGLELEARDLGKVDYVVSPRVAIVRKSERDLAPWVTLGLFHRGLVQAREAHPVVVLILERWRGGLPATVRRGALARVARRGIAVLEAEDADDAAAWIARIAVQEKRAAEEGWAPSRKSHSTDRLAEEIAAWLPGVSFIGARRLLEHFGSLRAIANAEPEEIQAVPGFGDKRARAIAELMSHPYRTPDRDDEPVVLAG